MPNSWDRRSISRLLFFIFIAAILLVISGVLFYFGIDSESRWLAIVSIPFSLVSFIFSSASVIYVIKKS